MAAWDACVDPELSRVVGGDRNLPICVGVDAGVRHDSTAVLAVTWDRATEKVRLVWHRVFKVSPDDPTDFEEVENTLRWLHANFRVVQIFYDPYQLAATMQRLERDGLPVVEFAQSPGNLVAMGQNLYDQISGRNLVVYPDAEMRVAVSRAVALETPRGWRLAKVKAADKIDVVVALAMAVLSAVRNQVAPTDWVAIAAQVCAAPPYRSSDAAPDSLGLVNAGSCRCRERECNGLPERREDDDDHHHDERRSAACITAGRLSAPKDSAPAKISPKPWAWTRAS